MRKRDTKKKRERDERDKKGLSNSATQDTITILSYLYTRKMIK
jgi:hypothetical protein